MVVVPALSLKGLGLGTASFGTNIDEVIGRISVRLGPPTSDNIAECDGGSARAISWPGLVAYGQGGVFVGYAHRAGSSPLSTPEGLELGDPIAKVPTLYGGYVFFNGSLGPEFTATASDGGTHHGFATTPTGPIFLLSAGFICVAR